jgi:hypothetical protein
MIYLFASIFNTIPEICTSVLRGPWGVVPELSMTEE